MIAKQVVSDEVRYTVTVHLQRGIQQAGIIAGSLSSLPSTT
jgi:hypothetical protein